jgi:hypothetical protein
MYRHQANFRICELDAAYTNCEGYKDVQEEPMTAKP